MLRKHTEVSSNRYRLVTTLVATITKPCEALKINTLHTIFPLSPIGIMKLQKLDCKIDCFSSQAFREEHNSIYEVPSMSCFFGSIGANWWCRRFPSMVHSGGLLILT